METKWDQLSKPFWCLSLWCDFTSFLNFDLSNFEIIWENSVIFIIGEGVFVLHLKGKL
jgi:hypothetical protein